MHILRRFSFLLLLPLLFTLSGCGLKPIVPKGIEGIKFLKLDPIQGLVILDLGMKIDNPNGIGFTLFGSELDVKVGGVDLGKVTINEKVKIKRKTEEVYHVKVNAKLADVIRSIPALIKVIAQKQANVEVKGWIRAGTLGLKKTIPVELKQEQVPASDQQKK
ncbi:MAG: LEA type 2 family protein [Bacteroidia bacterium]|jgi:LEA14-like dessication related protein|nr:LEA type 2 family protein [Bacteroidia bacterium]